MVNSEGRSAEREAAIVLVHFGCHDIGHQRFAQTYPSPHSQCSSPEVHVLQQQLRHEAMSTIQLSPLSDWPRQARAKRWCKSIRYLLEANFAFEMVTCTGQLNHLRASSVQLPTLNFWRLSCEHPRTLARDNTGICKNWTWAGFTTSTWLVTHPLHHYTHVHPCTLTCTKSTWESEARGRPCNYM